MENNIQKLNALKKQSKQLKLFLGGFTIYSLCAILATTLQSNFKLFQAIQLIGLALLIPSAVNLIHYKFDNQKLKIIFTLYFSWLLLIILRDFIYLFEFSYLKIFLLNPWYGGILYFTPLFLLFPKNNVFYKKIFDVIFLFGIFYIILVSIFFKVLVSNDNNNTFNTGVVENLSILSFSCGFLLFTYSYQTRRKQLISILVISMSFIFAIIRARRGLIFMYGNMVIFSYLFYLIRAKSKLILIYCSFFIFLIAGYYFGDLEKLENSRIFGFIFERGIEDTRSGVELSFFTDMNTEDWIIGRGMRGEYYCPDMELEQITDYRSVIETGYLQIILNGGLVSLILYLLITIPAIIKGIFCSENFLSKAAGIWIFLSMINLYPSSDISFSLPYLVVWICIGMCYSEKIRNIKEKDMYVFFQSTDY